ncbi:glycosyltransferase [Consotaella aegiceratis]|uniref:glycosyltransferase n=1 Tax=Consotaella aegiceratis TaxID=3097961 RepID=UPI002F3F636C
MRLAFISSVLPDHEPVTGFEIATRAIIEELTRCGVELSFVGFTRPGERPLRVNEISLGEIEFENAAVGTAKKIEWVAQAFSKGLPVAAAKLAVLSRDEIEARIAAAGEVDGFVLNSVQMPAAYPFLASARPSIFIAHNVEHRSAAENAINASSPLERGLYRREARLLAKIEQRLCREARLVHTFSAEDAAGLCPDAGERCIPLALSIGRPQRADDGERSHDVGLIGNWSWAPNRVGLDWFVREVAPLLPSDVSVAIAGRFDGPPPAAPASVRFLGRVPDAQGFVLSSRVIALATKGGTGVQLKTIEAFEEGMPAVATPSALRGVDFCPANVRVADDPAAFAVALADLVRGTRDGTIGREDGSRFAARQREALSNGLRRGLAAFSPTSAAASIAGDGASDRRRPMAGHGS